MHTNEMLYSERVKLTQDEKLDPYIFDDIPYPLRVKINYIWDDTIKAGMDRVEAHDLFERCVETLRRQYGTSRLASEDTVLLFSLQNRFLSNGDKFYKELVTFFLKESDIDRVIDAIELSFREIEQCSSLLVRENKYGYVPDSETAISNLNQRFKEHGVGYQYENGYMVRVDSEFVHQEVTKPALRLLSGDYYQGAQNEFLRAHEHYRKGNMKEAVTEASKALESTLIAIFKRRNWCLPKKRTASSLLTACIERKLIPKIWQSNFTHLGGLLKSISTARNDQGAHGQGTEVVELPTHVATFALHMTASAIVFLAGCEEEFAG